MSQAFCTEQSKFSSTVQSCSIPCTQENGVVFNRGLNFIFSRLYIRGSKVYDYGNSWAFTAQQTMETARSLNVQ